jgi:hypothetical protein
MEWLRMMFFTAEGVGNGAPLSGCGAFLMETERSSVSVGLSRWMRPDASYLGFPTLSDQIAKLGHVTLALRATPDGQLSLDSFESSSKEAHYSFYLRGLGASQEVRRTALPWIAT